jgi:cell division protein FtsB
MYYPELYRKNVKQMMLEKRIIKEWNVQTSTKKDKGHRPNVQNIKELKQIDLEVQSLQLEIKDLHKTNKNLKEENKNLKLELTKDIPHQDKLKKAIQLITLEAMEQGITHKVFSDDEYQDIIGTLSEVDFQKEQVQYLRERVEKQDAILTKLVNQVSEKNYIEARDKGYDKK